MNIIIASNRPFPERNVANPLELEVLLKSASNTNIFFPFWSWKISKEILKDNICIGFHTGDINGGSPIQNLIKQGREHTHIRVFKINDKIDEGEVIDTIPICLNGTLEEIILRETELIDDYIQKNYR